MITISMILTILATIFVLWILFKILGLVVAKWHLDATWSQIVYWVIVLLVALWVLGFLGIMQPIIKN